MAQYTDESNILLLIALLKAHGIKRIVASPGSTNMSFVASVQTDDFFQVTSCVDERSAAYIACGMAEESGDPVVISCTGATASRNYLSALTEAYYRKLPILAVTSTRHIGQMGQNIPQTIDRSVIQKDVAKKSIHIPSFSSERDKNIYTTLINDALLELTHRSKGPVHINLATVYSVNYSNTELPKVRVIKRITPLDDIIPITYNRVAIYVGSHAKWTDELTKEMEDFCTNYGAVALCDRTSNYFGEHRINPSVVLGQRQYISSCVNLDLMICIGEISGAYFTLNAKHTWRVHPDGEIRDTYGNLQYVFEFDELSFFRLYNKVALRKNNVAYVEEWEKELADINSLKPELPFSNIWAAQTILPKLPFNSEIHLGILSSLRSWNFFDTPKNICGYCNTGGFGIDGCVSTLVGASLVNPEKLFYGVFGDLAFFYDMNVLGNRHIGNNLRIIIINNGRGQEFCNYAHPGSTLNGREREFVAAEGHFGAKSQDLVKHYATDLGFEYMSASNKEDLINILDVFCSDKLAQRSFVLELFTNGDDDSEALKRMYTLKTDLKLSMRKALRSTLGDGIVNTIKKVIR